MDREGGITNLGASVAPPFQPATHTYTASENRRRHPAREGADLYSQSGGEVYTYTRTHTTYMCAQMGTKVIE